MRPLPTKPVGAITAAAPELIQGTVPSHVVTSNEISTPGAADPCLNFVLLEVDLRRCAVTQGSIGAQHTFGAAQTLSPQSPSDCAKHQRPDTRRDVGAGLGLHTQGQIKLP